MGQGIGRVPEAPAVTGAVDGGREPIGRYIGQQRRLRGIELEELAARTRIPRRSLERLEAGAFDHSPDGFSRGFVRTVAEAIGLDPDDAVARMLPEPDAKRHGSPRESRALGVIAAAIALAALALGARELVSRLPERAPRATGGLPVRRDFVSELAAQHGVAIAQLSARDAVLAPLPPAPEPTPDGPATIASEPAASGAGLRPHAASAAPDSSAPAASAAEMPPTAAADGSAAIPAAPAFAAGPTSAPPASPTPLETGRPEAAPPADAEAHD